jgi:hypothetical protein
MRDSESLRCFFDIERHDSFIVTKCIEEKRSQGWLLEDVKVNKNNYSISFYRYIDHVAGWYVIASIGEYIRPDYEEEIGPFRTKEDAEKAIRLYPNVRYIYYEADKSSDRFGSIVDRLL